MPAKRKIKSIAGRKTAGIPAKKTRNTRSSDGNEESKAPSTRPKRMVWLPTECWADTFKCLSRRDLLRSVQPACSRFHAIAEKRVDNVHIVRKIKTFMGQIEDNGPDANRHLEDIGASNATLAKHFRLTGNVVLDLHKSVRYLKSQKALMRNSLELFRGCKLELTMGYQYMSPGNLGTNRFVPFLALFQSARPWHISVNIVSNSRQWFGQFMNPCELLGQPLILHCMRLTFMNFKVSTVAKVGRLLEYHLPCAGGDHPNTMTAERTRVIIVWDVGRSFRSKLIERCKKNLLKAKGSADVRAYLVLFQYSNFDGIEPFRLDHSATGEVLQLEQVQVEPEHSFLGPTYLMRRCPAGDLATTEQFCRDTFTPDWKFKSPIQNEIRPPTVTVY